MSIQQSVNQLIGTSTVAAGLYAHQPSVQQEREAKSLETTIGIKEARAEKLKAADTETFKGDTTKLPDETFRAGIRMVDDIQNLYSEIRSGYERLSVLRPDRAEEYQRKGAVSKTSADNALSRIDQLQEQLEQRYADKEAQQATRASILEGTRPEGPKPREVIKYGK